MLFVGGTAPVRQQPQRHVHFHSLANEDRFNRIHREVNIPQPNWVPGLTRQGFGGESSEGELESSSC